MYKSRDSLQQTLKEKAQLEKASRLHWMHIVIVLGSLFLTLFAWYLTKQQVDERARISFDRQATQVVEMVSERMLKYEDALWSGVAAVQMNGGDIDGARWRTFEQNLHIEKKYPGINGVGIIHYLSSPDALTKYLVDKTVERPEYKVHPQHDKIEFLPITYIEPVNSNRAAVGLDVAHETNRYQAALKARDSGKAQITGPITLVQDAEKTPGFLFYVPFYKEGYQDTLEARRQSFRGMVYAPFVMKKLLAGTLRKENRLVSIAIKDDSTILYDENQTSNPDFDPAPLFSREVVLKEYGREWAFNIQSTQGFRHSVRNNQPMIILVTGFIIDTLLLSVFILLSRASRRALDFSGRVTESYKIKQQELEASNRELEQFAYIASHDLKAPLRHVTVCAGFLEQDYKDKLDSKAQDFLKIMTSSTKRMQQMIDTLLEYSRINTRDKGFTIVDTGESAKEALENLSSTIAEAGAEIIVHEMPRVNGEKALLTQLIQNLIDNSLKYRKEGQVSKIEVSAQRNGAEWIFSVTDNGIGIEPRFSQKIFVIFQRLHAEDEYSGIGIGLAFCQRIVELHGGRIWLDAEYQNGSKIMFSLPVSSR